MKIQYVIIGLLSSTLCILSMEQPQTWELSLVLKKTTAPEDSPLTDIVKFLKQQQVYIEHRRSYPHPNFHFMMKCTPSLATAVKITIERTYASQITSVELDGQVECKTQILTPEQEGK